MYAGREGHEELEGCFTFSGVPGCVQCDNGTCVVWEVYPLTWTVWVCVAQQKCIWGKSLWVAYMPSGFTSWGVPGLAGVCLGLGWSMLLG